MKKQRKQKERKESSSAIQRFWYSRASLFLFCGLFLFAAFSVVKEAVLRIERQQEIAQLENEIIRLQERNVRTEDMITLLNSSAKQEKLLRSKLGVQKQGEEVVFFPGDRMEQEKAFETPDAEIIKEEVQVTSNPEKWMNYFLGKYNQ